LILSMKVLSQRRSGKERGQSIWTATI
jgi:hypothetical protein